MELLVNIIIEYLRHNKRLVVPKLGAFIVKQGGDNIVFSELMRTDDGVLRSLLMAYGMKELEANGAIDRMVFEIRHATSRNKNFTIEGLGDFIPGPNNTIIFKQYRKATSVGGNIRPPVERLHEEQMKALNRQQLKQERGVGPIATTRVASQYNRTRPTASARMTRAQSAPSQELDIHTITKPDSHLRGLKYDSSKNKKRDDGMGDSSSMGMNRKRNMLIVIVVAIIIGVATWFAWSAFVHDKDAQSNTMTTQPELMIVTDSISTIDSMTMVDTMIDNGSMSTNITVD